MRYIWPVLAVVVIVATAWFIWWFGWGRLTSGPPDAVVQDFLRAVQAKDWGTAEAYMTQHVRGRIGSEGSGAMQRFVDARLEAFTEFQIVRATPRGDEVDVVVRLLLPIPEGELAAPDAVKTGGHSAPGRIEGRNFVHAHRFVLQQEGLGAWRIYQFEEVDARR